VRNIAGHSTAAYTRDIDTIELNRMNRMASIALQGADFQYAAANAVGTRTRRMVSGITTSLLNFGSTLAGGGTKGFDMGTGGSTVNSGSFPSVTPGASSAASVTSGISPVAI
jgi:hypothetical protein